MQYAVMELLRTELGQAATHAESDAERVVPENDPRSIPAPDDSRSSPADDDYMENVSKIIWVRPGVGGPVHAQ